MALNPWKLMGAQEPNRAALVRVVEALHAAADRKLRQDAKECARLQRLAERLAKGKRR